MMRNSDQTEGGITPLLHTIFLELARDSLDVLKAGKCYQNLIVSFSICDEIPIQGLQSGYL